MIETNEGLLKPHDVQNNCWRMKEMKETVPLDVRNNCWWIEQAKDNSYQMEYKTTFDERQRSPYQMMYKTTVDGSDQPKTTHTRWCTKQLLMDERDEESTPDGVLNNRWWTTPVKDYQYQMVYKTTVDEWEMKESIPNETTVDE